MVGSIFKPFLNLQFQNIEIISDNTENRPYRTCHHEKVVPLPKQDGGHVDAQDSA
jgi:hypothetical protein